MKKSNTPRVEQDAALLFDLMNGEDSDATYEVGCVLDEFINAAGRVYGNRRCFTEMYAETVAEEGADKRVTAILRLLRQGTSPAEIARLLKEGNGFPKKASK